MRGAVILAALTSLVLGADLRATIQERIQNVVQMGLENNDQAAVTGIQNCHNKCDKLFNHMAYSIVAQGGPDAVTNEYRACIVGCDICVQQQNSNGPANACLTTCKDTNFLDASIVDSDGKYWPIVKGVIEPDKACQIGCLQQLCQGVCTGGTTDVKVTPANKKWWWSGAINPNKGCSLTGLTKGGYFAQNSDYNYWNAPAGSGGQKACCSNGMSLCQYVGDKNTDNYRNTIISAKTACKNVPGVKQSVKSICNYVKNKSNCGDLLT